jgi:hypothetical protein
MNNANQSGFVVDEQHPREVEFFIINNDTVLSDGARRSARNTGTLIDLNSAGMGILTHVPLQPGDMVELHHDGVPAKGIVMWSIASSSKFRIQMKFV